MQQEIDRGKLEQIRQLRDLASDEAVAVLSSQHNQKERTQRLCSCQSYKVNN